MDAVTRLLHILTLVLLGSEALVLGAILGLCFFVLSVFLLRNETQIAVDIRQLLAGEAVRAH